MEDKKSFNPEWERIHASKNWGGYPSEHVIRFVARNFYNVSNRADVKILDFGCGAGAHTWYLSREGFDTYAFDGSESAINRTKERLLKDGYAANVIVADGLTLPYEPDFFDAIIDNVSIQANTTDNIKAMYKECYKLLKKQGMLFTSVFGKDTEGYGKGKEVEKGTYEDISTGATQSTLKHFFDKEELFIILKESGFINITIDEIRYTDNGVMIHQYYVIART